MTFLLPKNSISSRLPMILLKKPTENSVATYAANGTIKSFNITFISYTTLNQYQSQSVYLDYL